MTLLAIDPGNIDSAWLMYDHNNDRPLEWGKVPNDQLLDFLPLASWKVGELAVEMIASYGMPVGREVFDTCVWIGRFIERWNRPYRLIYRGDVKDHLCHSRKATDANIRQALIDRYGPGKDRAIGRKATPGPLYGLTGDCWAALGVAVTAADTMADGTAA